MDRYGTGTDHKCRQVKRGIIGISQNAGALACWFLTSHECSSATTALKRIFKQEHDYVDIQKEAGAKRVTQDEPDVWKLVSCFTTELMATGNHFMRENPGKGSH